MITFELTITFEERTESVELRLPNKLSEITLSQFNDFIVMREQWPDVYREYEEGNPEERVNIGQSMSNDDWTGYLDKCAEVFEIFVGIAKMRVIYLLLEHSEAQFLMLYYMLLSIMNQPSDIAFTFEYKSQLFILPEAYTNRNDYTVPGYSLKLIEAIEGFQYEHFYNAKNESGEYVLADRRKQTIMAQCAAFCRRIEKDDIETFPLKEEVRRRFMDERITFFSEITLDIALGVERAGNMLKSTMEKHTQIGELFNNDPTNENEIKRAIKAHRKWKRWGWYTMLQDVAAGGMFKQDGKTPLESAMDANFWDAMFWLAHRADMSKLD